MKMKHNSSPLPFQGQKRNFVKQFKAELIQHNPPVKYVDLFGGSGLLSRCAKDVHPQSHVIYNDYDNFRERLNAIPKTNILLNDIRGIIGDLKGKKRIPDHIKSNIIERIERENGFVDYITLSSYLLFSMNYAKSLKELKKSKFYNRLRKIDLPNADTYLDGLEVVKYDYLELFEKYKNDSNVVFIVDPPYLSTDSSTYNENYWTLSDHLDTLKVLDNQDYFYFTSSKSEIVDLCQWIEDNTGTTHNPFSNATTVTRNNSVNYQSSYTDIMIYKWN